MTPLGVDISSNQHSGSLINWRAVDPAVEFVVVKATQGRTYQNPYFDNDYEKARESGRVVGPYHWVSPTSSPASQVSNCISVIRSHYKRGVDLPVGLDFEEAGTSHTVLDQVRAGLNAAGYPTMTYTYPYFWMQYGDPRCSQCAADPFWYAWYNKTTPKALPPWKEVAIWQYAGTSGIVEGIPGKQDMNRLLVAMGNLGGSTSTSTPDEEEDVAQWWHESNGTEWSVSGVGKKRLTSPAQRQGFQDAGLLSKTRIDVKAETQKAILAQLPEVK